MALYFMESCQNGQQECREQYATGGEWGQQLFRYCHLGHASNKSCSSVSLHWYMSLKNIKEAKIDIESHLFLTTRQSMYVLLLVASVIDFARLLQGDSLPLIVTHGALSTKKKATI